MYLWTALTPGLDKSYIDGRREIMLDLELEKNCFSLTSRHGLLGLPDVRRMDFLQSGSCGETLFMTGNIIILRGLTGG